MPSREEIAAALKEAQSTINTLVICTGNDPSKYQPFSKLATQVENMRWPEWMIIDENTPKDREVLLFCPTRGVVTGRWEYDKYAKNPRPYWDNSKSRLYGIRSTREDQPTHWMPLPPALGDEATNAK